MLERSVIGSAGYQPAAWKARSTSSRLPINAMLIGPPGICAPFFRQHGFLREPWLAFVALPGGGQDQIGAEQVEPDEYRRNNGEPVEGHDARRILLVALKHQSLQR